MVNIEAAWDEPWRSLSETHVRHLAVVLSLNAAVPPTNQGSDAAVTLRFWTSGYSVVSAAEIDNPGDPPKPLAFDATPGAIAFSVQLRSAARRLVVLTIAMAKSVGLREGIAQIGVLRIVGGKNMPLELNCGFSPAGETVYWMLAAGIAAELATRTVLAAEDISRLASDLSRCDAAADRSLAAQIAEWFKGFSLRPDQQTCREGTRLASELAAALWRTSEQKRAPAASAPASGAPYALGSAEDVRVEESPAETPPAPQPHNAQTRFEEVCKVPDGVPESLRPEWAALRRRYNAQIERRDGIDVVRVQVARHQVEAWLKGFPKLAPTLRISSALKHAVIGRGGAIRGLSSVTHWNRTLGLAHVLEDLERRWGVKPPVPITGPSTLSRLRGWLKTNTTR